MSRRGENIRKRKDGRWEGRYKIGLKENGSTKYASVYGHTYSECKNKLENKRASNNINEKTKHKKQKFKDVLYLWLSITQIHVKKSTIAKYQNIIETHILSELGDFYLSDLNSNIINTFLDKKLKKGKKNCNNGLSPSYVRSIAIIIESTLKYAQKEGFCSPLSSPILKPPIKKKQLNILTIDAQNILESILLTDMDVTKLGVYIVLQTGLRLGEICALEWDDIDLKSKIINVKNTVTRVRCDNHKNTKSELIIDSAKTESSVRKIPISSVLLPILIKMHKSAIVALVIDDGIAYAGHVGDTRLYCFQKNKLKWRTLDHSVPQMLALAGDIKEKDIRKHSDRNMLLKVIGTEWDEPQYELALPVELKKDTAFLLCSDGFWEFVDEKMMQKTLKKSKTAKQWCESMVEIVKSNGKGNDMDNFSAITVFCK